MSGKKFKKILFVMAWCRNPTIRHQTLKIAIILKEVNDLGGDLREFLSEGARPEPRDETWDNVTRWVCGIKNLPSIREWSFYEEITRDCRKETLKSIVAMNLKKSPGGASTEPKALAAAARADKDYIRRQYSLYDPDITICGGTGVDELFLEAVGSDGVARNNKRCLVV